MAITNDFQNILDKSDRKPNKIWVDKGSVFYYSYFRIWLKDKKNYSTYNKGKYAVAGRFIRTLKFTNTWI